MTGRLLILLVLAWAAPQGAAHAQLLTATLGAGAVSVRFADEARFAATTLSPALQLRAAHFSGTLSATFSQVGAGQWSRQGTVAASAFTNVSARGWLGEASLAAGGSVFPAGASTSQLIGSARAHWLGAHASAWLGGGAGTMNDGISWRAVRQAEVGLSSRRGVAGLTLLATPTVADDTLRYADLLAALQWSRGAVDLVTSLGGRLGATLPFVAGGDQRLWGNVTLTAWVAPRVALTAGAGTYPVDLTQGFPAGQYVSLGLRFGGQRSPLVTEALERQRADVAAREAGITTMQVWRLGSDRLRIRLRAPGAARVELMGDPTRWSVVPLVAEGDGWWRLDLHSAADVIELVLRLDGGAWLVPPGAEAVTDEFGGRSGRVVLPPLPGGV